MNKAALIDAVSERSGLQRRHVEEMLDTMTLTITDALVRGETVTITGFGAFMPKFRAARMGVNPQKPDERMEIPAVTIPKFKSGKRLKDALKDAAPQAALAQDTTATDSVGSEEE